MSAHSEASHGAPDDAEFIGPDDGRWYRTQIPDWIALCPQVNHTAYRLYVIVRSLILEKQPQKVRLLSHEQLAFLLPGPNGKPSGVRTIKDALQALTEVGLVSNPDGERIVTSGGKGAIRTRRRYQLHDWPTAKVAMTVWRNAFDKLDAFTEDWRETRTDVSASENVGQNSAPRSNQAPAPTPDALDTTSTEDFSAGQFVGRDSASTGRDSASTGRDSARNADTTSADADSLKQFPQGVSSSSGVSDTAPAPRESAEDEEESPSAHKPRGPVDLVLGATDATDDEAQALVDTLRPEATKSLGGYVRRLSENGDLEHRLWLLRRQHVSESRAGASQPPRRATCALHHIQVPCSACRSELISGEEFARPVIEMYRDLGPDAATLRPDLADHAAILNALATTG